MEWKKFCKQAGVVALSVLAVWGILRFLLPVMLPFLVAFGLSKVAQPAVERLYGGCHLPRWLASSMVISLLLFGVFWILYGLAQVIWSELARLTSSLPGLLTALEQPVEQLQETLLEWVELAPMSLQNGIENAISEVFTSGSMVAQSAYEQLFSLVTSALSGVPQLLLFWVTTLVASFMICGQYQAISGYLSKNTPKSWGEKLDKTKSCLRTTLSAWLKAQAKLWVITFGILTAGLMILGVSVPFLMGALIALVDALPLFGSGTILIPWAILSLIQGDSGLAIGLAVLYGVGYFARSMLEPRLVGKQMGLHPLVTLMALYGGFQFFGVVGMILCPFGAILVKQLTAKP